MFPRVLQPVPGTQGPTSLFIICTELLKCTCHKLEGERMNYNYARMVLWAISAMTQLVTIPVGAQGLPEGKGKEQFERICRNCHPLDVATRTRHDKDGWAGVVEDMVARGAQGKQDDLKQVAEYLATNFGPNNPIDTSTSPAPVTPAPPSAPKVDESASKPGDAGRGKR